MTQAAAPLPAIPPAPFRAVAHEGFSALVTPGSALGISMCLMESFSTDCHVEGRRSVQTPRIGEFALIAPGHPVQVTITGSCRALQFWLPFATMARIVEEEQDVDGNSLEFAPSFDHFDLELFAKLTSALASDWNGTDVHVREVVLHLCRRHSRLAERPVAMRLRRGGLTPARLRSVKDLVEARLEHAIPLETLAAEAALSPYHFAREFKRTVGRTPHSYVIERRLARALTLLGRPDTNVDEVARQVGFSHGSHLSRHLRAYYGASAAEFRTLAQA